MYRPEGWEEKKWKDIPYNCPLISGEQVANVYEAGADAMLEGLREDCQKHITDKNGEWVLIMEDRSGCVVFIPWE
ncbi:hypothetical protein LCGC14_0349600 [marine sediment metagenome]|uniref:Uncharacterized protein n=1 Tax=marine sediment metagenome TaxID=412755 RepID=A0A0F9WJ19_9ZZZZ